MAKRARTALKTITLVKAKELADQCGVSTQRVSQYARDGMARKKIKGIWHYDLEQCTAWIRDNYPDEVIKGGMQPGSGRPPKGNRTKAEATNRRAERKAEPKAKPKPESSPRWVDVEPDDEDWADTPGNPLDPAAPDPDPSGMEPFNELRRRNELEKLRLARIERMQKEGQLVDVTEIRQEYTRKVSAAATHLRNAGKVLAGDIAARFSIPTDRTHELTTLIEQKLHSVSLQLATQRYGGPEQPSKAKGGSRAAG